jgi:hypothetical protein
MRPSVNERRYAGRHALADSSEYAAESESVHHGAGHQAVPNLRRAWPACTGDERDHNHHDHGQHHAHGEKGQRFDIRQPKARADEAGAPQHHEQHGRCRNSQRYELAPPHASPQRSRRGIVQAGTRSRERVETGCLPQYFDYHVDVAFGSLSTELAYLAVHLMSASL